MNQINETTIKEAYDLALANKKKNPDFIRAYTIGKLLEKVAAEGTETLKSTATEEIVSKVVDEFLAKQK